MLQTMTTLDEKW